MDNRNIKSVLQEALEKQDEEDYNAEEETEVEEEPAEA